MRQRQRVEARLRAGAGSAARYGGKRVMNGCLKAGGAMAGRRPRTEAGGGGCGAAVPAVGRGGAWGASYRPLSWNPEAMRELGLPVATELEMSCENEATREAVRRLTVAHFWTG